MAKSEGCDCVVTISNQIAPSPGVHPTEGLKVRSNSKVLVHHLSWTKLLTSAVKEKTHRGIDDREQAWILGELIRYLEHPNSGVVQLDDMGENWVPVRDCVRDGTADKRDDAIVDIAQRWDQLLSFASLKLGATIGEDVIELVPRAQQQDPRLRTKDFVESMCADGTLAGSLRIPNTVGDLEITVDLKARRNIVSVSLDAPEDKGGIGRVGWLLRQLKDAPNGLVIRAFAKNSRSGVEASLLAAREDPCLLLGPDKRSPTRFTLISRTELDVNRRAGRNPGFVQSVIGAIESFYGEVIQNLSPYQPTAPRINIVAENIEAADNAALPPS